MSKVTRNDIFVRSERGAEWFNDFLESFAKDSEGSTKDILDAIQDKRNQTVQGVVDKYRKMVGLDIQSDENNNDDSIKAKAHRPLSIRHAKPLENIVVVIENDPKLKEDIRSLCEHSGGTKNTHSIINYLRNKLGKDIVSYSNDDLIKYIEEAKKEYQEDKEKSNIDVGRVGTNTEDYPEDNVADYITHGKGM